jgi:hypothetical protein
LTAVGFVQDLAMTPKDSAKMIPFVVMEIRTIRRSFGSDWRTARPWCSMQSATLVMAAVVTPIFFARTLSIKLFFPLFLATYNLMTAWQALIEILLARIVVKRKSSRSTMGSYVEMGALAALAPRCSGESVVGGSLGREIRSADFIGFE